jgi:hypothetical protein
MPHGNTLSRLLIATLAAGAIAAPAAGAMPMLDSGGESAPVQKMDMRGEATKPTETKPAPASPRQLPGPPTWPMHPKPITPTQVVVADDGDGGGVDAPILAAIIAGTLAVGAGFTVAGLRHRTNVAH